MKKCLILFVMVLCPGMSHADQQVRFSVDVLPILSEHCFSCHGPDEKHRKGGLRLDDRDAAIKSGAIVPGKPSESELLKRIHSPDSTEVMPPPKFNKKLSALQTKVLEKWLAQGAPWGKHWAFEAPQKAALPKVSDRSLKNPIDLFVASALEARGLKLSPRAADHSLLRRASFDLKGLPPTSTDLQNFLNDKRTDRWEKAIDQMLASPHHGERMAMWWLDAARYSDTDGYQSDETRTNWPWRDWVIQAFNSNMPFDRFTLEQFAGDLLPNSSVEQKLATCFHRNHMTNGEGGRDPEESRIDYVIDRINTVGTVWMGLTLGCCQCHSHKYDPISHAEYYSLFSFFNSIDEDGKAGKAAKPYLAYESPYAKRAVEETQKLVDARRQAEQKARQDSQKPFEHWLEKQNTMVHKSFSPWHLLKAITLESVEGTTLHQHADGIIQASGKNPRQDDYKVGFTVALDRVTGFQLEIFPDASHTQGAYSRGASGEFILTDIKVQVRRKNSSQIRDIPVSNASADFSPSQKDARNYGDIKGTLDDDPRNGWTTKGESNRSIHRAVFALAEPLILEPAEEVVFELRQRSTTGDSNLGKFRLWATNQPGIAVQSVAAMPLEELARLPENNLSKIDSKLRDRLFEQFLYDHPSYQQAKSQLDKANRQLAEVKKAQQKVDVMVLAERKEPRLTQVLERGVWDKKGEKVERSVPKALSPWPTTLARDRRGLAQWLTSRENPLTARVMVNHLWQLCFGSGLVRTPEDFGVQGERPTHPELLDWLAVEFMESGWNLRHILKLITTSETYAQSSVVSAQLLNLDPENKLLARGPRYRLPSWMLRDSALLYAGLLNPALGGPPVKPHQPDGLWEEIFMGRFRYEPSEGEAQYRRTLYAFWRRSISPAFLFDSAQRRVCEIRIPRTNTPLHALTLLNDRTMLEASQAIALKLMRESREEKSRIDSLGFLVLGRAWNEKEKSVLMNEWKRSLEHFQKQPESAAKLLSQKLDQEMSGVPSKDLPTLAAHTMLASMVLNLDEAITHE